MTDSGESDETLIRRYASGDPSAFETLYARHEMRIWRYLERHLRNRAVAEELLQEVWFAVAREAAGYEPAARFTTWLFTIAHNRMVDALRVTRPQVSLETVGYEANSVIEHLTAGLGSDPLGVAMAQDQRDAMLRAVESLPSEQRDVFLLRVEGELSIEEIATITRSTFETVRSRLRYARSKLRELLHESA